MTPELDTLNAGQRYDLLRIDGSRFSGEFTGFVPGGRGKGVWLEFIGPGCEGESRWRVHSWHVVSICESREYPGSIGKT